MEINYNGKLITKIDLITILTKDKEFTLLEWHAPLVGNGQIKHIEPFNEELINKRGYFKFERNCLYFTTY